MIANRSGHSPKMSHHEQIAQVTHQKWPNEQIAHFFERIDHSLIFLLKTSDSLRKPLSEFSALPKCNYFVFSFCTVTRFCYSFFQKKTATAHTVQKIYTEVPNFSHLYICMFANIVVFKYTATFPLLWHLLLLKYFANFMIIVNSVPFANIVMSPKQNMVFANTSVT